LSGYGAFGRAGTHQPRAARLTRPTTELFGVVRGIRRVAFRCTTAHWSTARPIPASQRNLHPHDLPRSRPARTSH